MAPFYEGICQGHGPGAVGLIRSESAGDLRTLAATGASGLTRHAITSATAGALLAGALGSAVAFAAVGRLFARRQPAVISRQPLD
jgi:hypothetical protein